MYQRILVPLDGSTLSEAALPHAEKLARALNVEIVLLHVDVSPALTFESQTSPLAPLPEEVKIMRTDEASYIKTMCTGMEHKGLRVNYLFRDGVVADAILEAAETTQADLIIMSTHGRTGLLRLLLGSVAEQVVRQSKIPVMLIRPIEE